MGRQVEGSVRPNEVKRKLRAGQASIGCFVGIPSPEVVEICGFVGFDWVMIDAEHGPMTTESAYHMVLAAEASRTTPLIRVPENNQSLILRHLDIGAAGVMVPQVNSPAEARAVVEAVKYHPHGHRGLAPTRASDYGLSSTLRDYTVSANDETLVIVQIENIAAVEHAAEISRVPGVDVVLIGPSDLAQSMGYPGQLDHPEVLQTIEQVCVACRGGSAVLGTIAATAEATNRLLERGFLMIGSSASGLLAGASQSYLAGVRR